jgi:hypothetical protein
MVYTPSFIKIGSGIQTLIGAGGGDKQAYGHTYSKVISYAYFCFFKIREVGLKIMKICVIFDYFSSFTSPDHHHLLAVRSSPVPAHFVKPPSLVPWAVRFVMFLCLFILSAHSVPSMGFVFKF